VASSIPDDSSMHHGCLTRTDLLHGEIIQEMSTKLSNETPSKEASV
jgi:hypothetical protein